MRILYLDCSDSTIGNTLINELKEHEIVAPSIPIDPDEAVEQITRILATSQFQMIIGFDLGAFYANLFANAFRILINPTHKPSETVNLPSELLQKFIPLEKRQFDDIRHAELWGTWGVFSSNNETFKHDHLFKECYLQSRYVPCNHTLTPEEVSTYITPLIREIIDNEENIRREIQLMEMTDLISDFT